MNYFLHRIKQIDWVLFFSAFALSVIGLIFIYNSSFEQSSNFNKQVVFLIVGIILMFLASFFDWRSFRENPYLILAFYFFCLFALGGLFFFAPEISWIP